MLAATTFGAASLCPPKLHSRVRSGLQRAPLLPTQPGVPPIRRRRRSRPAAPTALLWGKKPAVVERPMTMADFNSMIETATTPAVLVDFCTAWCGPCKVLDNNIKCIEKAHAGKVTFEKVDTEKHPEVADAHRIQKLPTLVLFRDGQQVDRYEGLMSGQDLDMWLRKHVK